MFTLADIAVIFFASTPGIESANFYLKAVAKRVGEGGFEPHDFNKWYNSSIITVVV